MPFRPLFQQYFGVNCQSGEISTIVMLLMFLMLDSASFKVYRRLGIEMLFQKTIVIKICHDNSFFLHI